MFDRRKVLKNLLNTELKDNIQMGDHIAWIKSQFFRLAVMSSKIEEQRKVAILLSSLSERQRSAYTIVSVKTIQDEMAE